MSYVEHVEPVDTNIVLFSLKGMSREDFLARLAAQQIKAITFGTDGIRMVTHLDFTDEMLERLLKALKELK
jgi:threonine aldolase